MAIIKCKMCGGDLNVTPGMSICECEYCGSKQTVPSADNEKKLTLFARANRLRLSNEFDKAAGIYESIVADFPEEAEAYWGLVLCRYGIEYVDDPLTGKKIPTCHRSSFDSVMDDPDFDQAQENADSVARKVYREEAKQIEEIRKSIIEVSGKEAPYDIFICYKETDENGERTIDSVIAQDVYDALTDKGYRVFFSRISLEDKLGTEYEPYIFAALNSAKLMLVFGTDYEYFNAVWVKNERGRYLRLMAGNKAKHLIPCYKGVDAYDMPKEFAKLQAQDMGKVGAIQDLVRGIGKLFGRGESVQKESAVVQQVISSDGKNMNALMIRGLNSLEDGAFEEACKFFDQVLNMDATSAEAYLGLFMADMKARSQADAKEAYINGQFSDNRYWKRAFQYSKGDLEAELHAWEEERRERTRREEEERREKEEEKRLEREKLERERREKREKLHPKMEELRAMLKRIEEEHCIEAENLEEQYKQIEAEYENMPEREELKRLDRTIVSLKKQADELGIFKTKEKKQIAEEIATLERRFVECQTKIHDQQILLTRKQEEANEKKNSFETSQSMRKAFIEEGLSILELLLEGKKIIKFGRYKQSKMLEKEPIEWEVLRIDDEKAILVSQYALDCRMYDNLRRAKDWKNCALRKWLNNDFLNNAFTEAEQGLILETDISVEKIPEEIKKPAVDTSDKVYLLSIEEVNQLFASETGRKCRPTEFAIRNGAISNLGNSPWWLRTPGNDLLYAAIVNVNGSIDVKGRIVCSEGNTVRPALWIRTDPDAIVKYICQDGK